jgi:hypothetical protein
MTMLSLGLSTATLKMPICLTEVGLLQYLSCTCRACPDGAFEVIVLDHEIEYTLVLQ